jgi:intron-binding protein aquarius
MRLCGYPAQSISILTTYRGQKHLLRDVFKARCDSHPLFGPPASISTVDKYQGQQNDIVLLSLVRTKHVGHLRDVRRLVVSLSRARLGVYVFGAKKIFENVDELKPALKTLMNDTKLDVIKGEVYGHISRKVEDAVSNDVKKSFKDSDEFATFIDSCALEYKKAALEHLKNQQQQ